MRRSFVRIIQPCRFFYSSNLFSTSSLAPEPPSASHSTRFLSTSAPEDEQATATPQVKSKRDAVILQKFRLRQLKGASAPGKKGTTTPQSEPNGDPLVPRRFRLRQLGESSSTQKRENPRPPPSPAATGNTEVVSGFAELGLSGELVAACEEMGMVIPNDVQCVGIPEVLKGRSLVMSSRSGYSRTLAYLLPLLQLLRKDAASFGTKRECPRAIVLCGSVEQCDKVFETAKFINEHARLKSARGGTNGQTGDKEGLSSAAIGLLVGTPEEILQQIGDRDVVATDVRYLVVDEADILLGSSFSPEIATILSQLKNIQDRSNDPHFQTVLVTSTISELLEKQLVEPLERDQSGKVAAVILDVQRDEIMHLMRSPDALKKKLAEAVESFKISASGS